MTVLIEPWLEKIESLLGFSQRCGGMACTALDELRGDTIVTPTDRSDTLFRLRLGVSV